MSLEKLYLGLADALDGHREIERFGRAELTKAAGNATYNGDISILDVPFLEVMIKENAHPVCELIKSAQLLWASPQTSNDPAYIAHSTKKSHVELIGPDGLVKSDQIRLGLYGMLPGANYGVRTHPAEEVFVMLAGEAYWRRGEDDYKIHTVGERSYHPSGLPHATLTDDKAFMSVYIWSGDVSTEGYVYKGIPT